MPKFTALTPIHHDGKKYSIGETLDLDGVHAQALLGIEAIAAESERKPGKKAEAERKAAGQAEAERSAAEAAEAAQLAAGDPGGSGDSHPV